MDNNLDEILNKIFETENENKRRTDELRELAAELDKAKQELHSVAQRELELREKNHMLIVENSQLEIEAKLATANNLRLFNQKQIEIKRLEENERKIVGLFKS